MSTPIQNLRQPLSENEKQFYGSIFKALDVESLGVVTGDGARSTFEKSGLPPAVLGEIWQLADPTNLGFLSEHAFGVAMRLIGHVQNGAKPDKSLIDYIGPIARIQGISGTASAPGLTHSATGSISSPQPQPIAPQLTSLPPLTNHDISKFGQLFQNSAPSGVISGEQARGIFLKAKLPTNVLSEIWSLSDKNNKGQLNRDEFIVAMFLIQGTINGSIRQLPQTVPQQIWDQLKVYQSPITTGGSNVGSIPAYNPPVTQRPNVSRVPSSFTNAANDWAISPQKRSQFESIFEGLDKESKGVLGPSEIAPFLMTSKLPQDVLANIWDLSDIHNTGEFTKTEFSIAMFLVQKKVAGAELPDVIPESLLQEQPQAAPIVARGTGSQIPPVAQTASTQSVPLSYNSTGSIQERSAIPQIPSRDTKPKSSLTDLVDLNDAFSTPSPAPQEAKLSSKDQSRTASSSTVQYTPAGGPKPFVPSSSFGQEIFEKQKAEAPKESPAPVAATNTAPATAASAPQANSPVIEQAKESSIQNKSVPQFTGSQFPAQQSRGVSLQSSSSFSQQQTGSAFNLGGFQQPRNDDLLADSNPEISGQLSQATADMANLSNQIGSLTSQTSQLHEKRGRAEKELAKITSLKQDIESKLSKLRVAYEQEVKQTEEVRSLLGSSKEETEQLRKESSVAEAQYNAVQSELQGLQSQLEESQKENASLKERLGTLNAEQIEVKKQLEKAQSDVRQSKGLAAINSKQLSTTEVTSSGLKAEIAALLSSVQEIDNHHDDYTKKLSELDLLKQQHLEKEQSLTERRALHEQNEIDFKSKEDELQSRLQEQQQRELQIQQYEEHIQKLFANLQERQRQLDASEQQLQQQQVEYAERVQAFSNKQIEDASNYDKVSSDYEDSSKPASKEVDVATEATEAVPSTSRDVPSTVDSTLSKDSPSGSNKGLIGAAVGAVAGAIGGTAVAATHNSTATESEKGNTNTEFSSPVATTTEQTTSVNSDDYQYEPTRDVQQFNLPIDRPESATSSVQNNAPQSVRGDDIEENPTIDSVVESPALASDVLSKDYNSNERPSEVTEVPEATGSPGIGSFEIVDHNKSESDLTLRASGAPKDVDAIEASIPGAWNVPDDAEGTSAADAFEADQESAEAKGPEPHPSTVEPRLDSSDPVSTSIHEDAVAATKEIPSTESIESTQAIKSVNNVDEEFPPIKELDINESESDDEEFHETSENLPEQTQKSKDHSTAAALGLGGATAAVTGTAAAVFSGIPGISKSTDQSKDFDFESPNTPQSHQAPTDDMFQDDFEGLEAAKEDTVNDEGDFNNTADFSEQLEGSNFYGADEVSQIGDKSPQQQYAQQGNNSEWEQIFAGFGNDPNQQQAGQGGSPAYEEGQYQDSSAHPYAKNAYGASAGAVPGVQANTSQPLGKIAQPEPQHPGQASSSSSAKHGRIATTPKSLAVQELTGMGFSKEEALNALTKEKWNLEAATNYLLDNA